MRHVRKERTPRTKSDRMRHVREESAPRAVGRSRSNRSSLLVRLLAYGCAQEKAHFHYYANETLSIKSTTFSQKQYRNEHFQTFVGSDAKNELRVHLLRHDRVGRRFLLGFVPTDIHENSGFTGVTPTKHSFTRKILPLTYKITYGEYCRAFAQSTCTRKANSTCNC